MAAKKGKKIMRRFALDELSSVDSPAQKGAQAVLLKRDDGSDGEPFEKGRATLVTSVDGGHAHALFIYTCDGVPDNGGTTTRGAAMDEEGDHDHPWVLDSKTGKIRILENRGHSHEVDAAGIFEVRLLLAKKAPTPEEREELRRKKKTLPDGSFPIKDKDDLGLAAKSIADAAWDAHGVDELRGHLRAVAKELGVEDPTVGLDGGSEFSYSSGGDSDDTTRGGTSMKLDQDKQAAADLEKAEKRANDAEARATALAELDGAEFTYWKGLDSRGQDRFLGMDAGARANELDRVSKADPIVYTDADGIEYRKSDGVKMIALAKRSDEDRKAAKSAGEAASNARYEKRASDEVSHLPGGSKVGVALLKAIDGIADDELRKGALEAVRAGDKALSGAFDKRGSATAGVRKDGGIADGATAGDKLDGLVREYAKANKVDESTAYSKVLDTEEGQALYAESVSN